MKKIPILFITMLFYQSAAFSQTTADTIHPVRGEHSDSTVLSVPGWDQDTLLFSEVRHKLIRAGNLATGGLVLGSMANLTLIVNAGFLSPDDVSEYDIQGFIATMGAACAGIRMFVSFGTIHQLNKAQKAILMMRELPGNESVLENSLTAVSKARKVTIMVPVLGATGIGLMFGGYYNNSKGNKTMENVCFGTAWAFAGAGLITSIISLTYINKAQKVLNNEAGSIYLGVNKYGIGLSWNF